MRVRLLAVLSAVTLFVLAAIPASATSEGHGYLALGDSVPFGFNPNRALWSNAANFTGYPELVAQRLNIEDTNATCPGEATGGFLSLTGTDNVCRPYRFLLKEPLHVAYTGTQMAFALAYLRSHPDTRLVTLTLGANDYFHLQNVCAFLYPGDLATQGACVLAGIPAMLATMQSNLNLILDGIRGTGYTGLIVAVTYYSLTYPDTSGADLLNGPMIAAASAHGAFIASGVEAWRTTAVTAGGGSTCAAGLRLPPFPPDTGTLGCDVHPTPLGAGLLADQVVSTIASTCPAHSAKGCLNRNRG
jgi:lysophospholipase L1-like esterase